MCFAFYACSPAFSSLLFLFFLTCLQSLCIRGEHGQDQDCISCGTRGIFSDQGWIWIFIFEKIGSGQDQDIGLISIMKFSWEWFKMSQMMAAVFSVVLVFILSVCLRVALITIHDNSGYFIANFFRPSGSSKLPVRCWYAALLCWMAYVCVLCRLIVYFRGGQLVFDWDRLENILITRDRPGGYKVTNTKYHEMQRFSFLFTFWNIDWKCSF